MQLASEIVPTSSGRRQFRAPYTPRAPKRNSLCPCNRFRSRLVPLRCFDQQFAAAFKITVSCPGSFSPGKLFPSTPCRLVFRQRWCPEECFEVTGYFSSPGTQSKLSMLNLSNLGPESSQKWTPVLLKLYVIPLILTWGTHVGCYLPPALGSASDVPQSMKIVRFSTHLSDGLEDRFI